MMNRLRLSALLSLLVLLLAGCSPILPDAPEFDASIALTRGEVLGQTFRADWDGLRGVYLHLTPGALTPGEVQLWLYPSSERGDPLYAATILLPTDLQPGWFFFPLEGLARTAGQTYYLRLKVEAQTDLELATGPGGAYSSGALYRDDRPVERQLEFHLAYSPLRAAAGLLRDAAGAAGWLLAFAAAFMLPGWALFEALWDGWKEQRLLNRMILASIGGTALYPIALLFIRLVGLPFGAVLAWCVPLAALGWYAWRFRKQGWRPKMSLPHPDLLDGLLAFALFAVLVTRLLPLRILEAGMWGDSVHHTLITQLLVERGGLFSSWEPYAPLTTFTYHFGFHASAAVLTWLTDRPPDQTVLWAGQWFNVLAVASLVPALEALWKALARKDQPHPEMRLAGLAAVVVAGLLSSVPMIYINWGRYTQLAGQALLLAWMVVALDLFRQDQRGFRREALAWILLAGLALTHYRVLVFAILWIAAYWLVQLRPTGWWHAVARTARVGIGAALLFLPWFWIVFGGKILEITGSQLATPAGAVSEAVENYNLIGDPARYLAWPLWALLAAALVWGLNRREKLAAVIGLWSLFLVLVANPGWLGLPGTGAINNFAVIIAAYIPAGLLLGAGTLWAKDLLQRLPRFPERGLALGGAAVVLLAALWGGAALQGTLNLRNGVLLTGPDREAFAWVREFTPETAVFLVNMASAGGGNTVAGSDGGWWLPYFTRRESLLPPFIFISEETRPPELRQDLLALYGLIQERGMDDPAVVDALKEWGVTHIYLGQQQGRVNGQDSRIDPAVLNQSSDYKLAYHVDRVWIFEIVD